MERSGTQCTVWFWFELSVLCHLRESVSHELMHNSPQISPWLPLSPSPPLFAFPSPLPHLSSHLLVLLSIALLQLKILISSVLIFLFSHPCLLSNADFFEFAPSLASSPFSFPIFPLLLPSFTYSLCFLALPSLHHPLHLFYPKRSKAGQIAFVRLKVFTNYRQPSMCRIAYLFWVEYKAFVSEKFSLLTSKVEGLF